MNSGVGSDPLLHVVLFQPEIPQNTGNIGRSCVAVGAKLWLIRPLGYQLDSRYLKRAGLDYWEHLDWEAIDSWDEVRQRLPHARVWCFTKHGSKAPWEATFTPGDILLFGSESRGLPETIRGAHASGCLRLPMHPEVRSLNLASTVNAVVYEAVRQFGGLPPR
ncbi:MAG: tRNA (cytidine(34)-2'-O)-methyltransferase [Planctomycetaceae bacterium]|nr:tRNA (cytidine(34)-2'-O)-methyltransferase [Planctomycetaceae bacterium]